MEAATKKLSTILDFSLDTNQGLSLLDVKNDSMLTYLSSLTALVLKKLRGECIEDVKTREKILHMRLILDRILPIEEKMKHQFEKMMNVSASRNGDVDGKAVCRADHDDLTESALEAEEDVSKPEESEKKAVYKPPKLASVPYDDESKAEKQRKLLENARKRALESSLMQELKETYSDMPLEISSGTTLRNTQTKYQKDREKFEETYFTRLPQTKAERHRDKLMSSMTVGTLASEITRFEDLSALEGRLPKSSSKRKKNTSQKKFKKKKGFKKRKTF